MVEPAPFEPGDYVTASGCIGGERLTIGKAYRVEAIERGLPYPENPAGDLFVRLLDDADTMLRHKASCFQPLHIPADVAAEYVQLLRRNRMLSMAATRLCQAAEALIADSSDPGTEAMAAVWLARAALRQ